MDRDEAKALLSRFRPGETDRGNLQMAEALAMVQHDPKLSAWFKEHCKNVAEHPGVALAPEKAEDEASSGSNSNLLIFGLIVFLVGIGIVAYSLMPKPQNRLADYSDRMSRLVQRSYPMKIATTNQADAREYFRTNGGAVGWTAPEGMENLPAKGAAVFTWQDQTVSLLGLQPPGGQPAYLFITAKSAFADPPTNSDRSKPEKIGGFTATTWITNDLVYLLTQPAERTVPGH